MDNLIRKPIEPNGRKAKCGWCTNSIPKGEGERMRGHISKESFFICQDCQGDHFHIAKDNNNG
jgi:Zn finger protein HypA/HybF involved in hydrogenase expression